ncbi:MAG TPA: N-acetylmuramoyl-L-alanine amidase-like domain-containing protein [Longimicrobium sp.]|nr:N-acetylmuramoyl-L-alanine amidase-like domain-containing protein [Longimicrobium sp.]
MDDVISRRSMLRGAALSAAALLVSGRLDASALLGGAAPETDRERLARWLRTLRADGLAREHGALGPAVARAGELALGTPYRAHTLEAYLAGGGAPANEPLTLHLDGFDCVTLVESAVAVARAARIGADPGWADFAREVERMRYRGGIRAGYASRLHYFSEWILDGARRGLVRDMGRELGGEADRRPLRFMTEHRSAYAALKDDATFAAIGDMERSLDDAPRWVIPTAKIPQATARIRTGDVLAFATSIDGLDASHTGMAYRDRAGVLRVLHAPLSGGEVEVSRSTLHGYVSAIRRATGVMVARPV